jgi:hypothetical protein
MIMGRRFRAKRMLLAAPAAVAVVALGGGMASAGTWHSINGTVQSSGWFTSPILRVATGGTIQTQLTSRPNQGLEWQLHSVKYNNEFGDQQHITSNSTYTNATDVIAGTVYENRYAQDSTCWAIHCNYNFSGQQYY